VHDGDPMAVGLLDLIATAGLWTNRRCHEAGYTISTCCQLCGYHDDSEYHRMWECKVVKANLHKHIVSSNHLCKDAISTKGGESGAPTAAQRWPCFWQRGLIPKAWLASNDEAKDLTWADGEFSKEVWNVHNQIVYVDESAGPFSSVPPLRRCGWGLVMLDSDRNLTGAMSSTLAGSKQTQVVACLDALLYLARHSEGDVLVKPDCNAAVEGLRNAINGEIKHFGPNAGWWHDIGKAIACRKGRITVGRVDAHADVKGYISQGIPIDDWIGNELADWLAGEGAKTNAVSLEVETNWFFLLGRAVKILQRAIAVHRLFLAEPGQLIARGVWERSIHPVHRAISESGHSLTKDGRGAYQCTRCGFRAGHRQLKTWLLGDKCVGLRVQGSEWRAPNSANAAVLIGNRQTHKTQSLAWLRGVWFCTSCGGYAKAVQDQKSTCLKLSKPCTKNANRGGFEVLDRISSGLPPRTGMQWPLPSCPVAVMAPYEMEALWPDRRAGSKTRHGQRSEPGERAVRQRGEGSEEMPLAQQEEEDLNRCEEFLLNEDEDPWGEHN
jgi:hypothetical protein